MLTLFSPQISQINADFYLHAWLLRAVSFLHLAFSAQICVICGKPFAYPLLPADLTDQRRFLLDAWLLYVVSFLGLVLSAQICVICGKPFAYPLLPADLTDQRRFLFARLALTRRVFFAPCLLCTNQRENHPAPPGFPARLLARTVPSILNSSVPAF